MGIASGNTNRGWVIIGLDLLIVLGVYFLYIGFMDNSDHVKTIEGPVTYRIEAERSSETSVTVSISINNSTDQKRTVQLPNGLRIQLSDGKRVVYWAENLVSKRELNLTTGETRSWSVSAPYPDNPPETLYAEFIVDTKRQARVTVPETVS